MRSEKETFLRKAQVMGSLTLLVFFAISSLSILFADSIETVPTVSAGDSFYHIRFRPEGSGIFYDRAHNFEIGQVGQWGERRSGRDGAERYLSFDHDSWGGGYGIDFELKAEKNASLGVSFKQAFSQTKITQTGLPGVGAGQTTSMAFIDGAAHGTPQTFGFFISASPTAGANAPAEVTLKHKLDFLSLSIYGRYEALKKDRISLYMLGGPAYTHFLQEYKFITSGTNASSGQPTFSETRETLYDYLFGGHLGLGAVIPIVKHVFLNLEECFGLFLRYSQMGGRQDIANAAGSTGTGSVFTALTERITIRERDTDLASQFQSKVSLGYQPFKHVNVELFYLFDLWLGLSRIRNILVPANFTGVLEGDTEIKNENLYQQTLGGRLVIVF